MPSPYGVLLTFDVQLASMFDPHGPPIDFTSLALPYGVHAPALIRKRQGSHTHKVHRPVRHM